MSTKKVIIIGAGITGLSAGTYLQMNGYDTEIFEMHSISGGLCTGWRRKGYTFDGCIHWLCGSRSGSEMYTLWEELGALQGKTVIDPQIFVHTELKNDKTFSVYVDPDKLKLELLKEAPEDKKLIEEFIHAIKVSARIDMPVLKPQEFFNIIDGAKFGIKAFPLLRILRKYQKVSIGDFQNKFKTPFLRDNFTKLFGMYSEMPLIALIYTLGLLSIKSAGYPIGGSLEFIKAIEDRYLTLGGKTNYNSKVEKIIVENNSAKGIILSDRSEHYADIIISAADGHYTIYNMLEGKFLNDEIEGYYKNYKLFPPIMQVSLGISREFDNRPDAVNYNFYINKPIYIDPKNTITELDLKIYSYDPTFASKGKTALTSLLGADYDYWTKLKKDNPVKYVSEKNRIASEIIDCLDEKFGDIKSKVETYDVATPYTFTRYTNNWKGSFEGFIPTIDNFNKQIKKELPGLNNFYMIGQWVQPGGGLPTGGMHGRHIAMLLCRKDKKKFKIMK